MRARTVVHGWQPGPAVAACRCRPAGRAAAAAAHAFASAAATASLSAVQPTMPPWAWIISMAAALKLGK